MSRDFEDLWAQYAAGGTPIKQDNLYDERTRDIFASWQRCLHMGISPYQREAKLVLSSATFEQVKEANSELIRFSLPMITQLYSILKKFEVVVTLSDSKGILLKIIGNKDVINTIKKGRFIEAADWSERSAGTNAIGTALELGRPMIVSSYEHFCRCSQGFSCSCAPIHDPNYQLIGAINITGTDQTVGVHMLACAEATAQAIEYFFVMQRAEANCCLANNYKTALIDSVAQGIIAVDSNGNIKHFNQNSREYFGISADQSIIGHSLADILPKGNDNLLNMAYHQELMVGKEIFLADIQGQKKRYNLTTRRIETAGKSKEDYLFLIAEQKYVKKMAQTLMSTHAPLTFDNIIGNSPSILQTINVARRAAESESNVLLLGESGTGKDVFAQAIHNGSSRAKGPFVSINCGAIPKELIVSELFGFTEGSFTGARKGGGAGKFELSDGGTLFLDEIGEMPLDLQPVLLRVLETRKVTRIGGKDEIAVDVRVIAATNSNLREKVTQGLFRLDLYYRLNIICIDIPPLRDRKSDIPLLIQYFYERVGPNKLKWPIPEEFMKELAKYDFPGNVRELQNLVERCYNLDPDGKLLPDNLPADIRNWTDTHPGNLTRKESSEQTLRLESDLNVNTASDLERLLIIQAMKHNNMNISKAAQELGWARSTLYRKLKKWI